jgi:hypothetical protein
MKAPSTEWKEIISPDEAARFETYAAQFSQIQKEKSAQYGNGRTLHRKQIVALKAELEILSDLPTHAQSGLFSKPSKYEVWIRLSNGGLAVAPDKTPDIRGFALKVRGLSGRGALGTATTVQDFLLINHETFGPGHAGPFVGTVKASSKGPLELLKYFYQQHGFFGMFSRIKAAKATLEKPFSGFPTEKFYSAAPIACGSYAARVRLVPTGNAPSAVTGGDWGLEIKKNLTQEGLTFDFQLQFFVDEKITPIEDASINWPENESPYLTVGKLTIPKQTFDNDEALAFSKTVESTSFDPWSALIEHRPLGEVMRARKVVYYSSQKARGAVSG